MHLNDLNKYPHLADGSCRSMTCHDGRKLRTALWPSTVSQPKGTIVLLQGRSEFIEKYFEVISELRQRGFAVATFDWRGQGLSDRMLPDRLKGDVERFSHYGRDLEAFLKKIVLPDLPSPHHCLAHSMGGLILLSNLPRLRTIIERAVLSAPLVEIASSQRKLLGFSIHQADLRKLSAFLRYTGFGRKYLPGASRIPIDKRGFYHNELTSDGPRYDRNRQYLLDHPELGIAGPTARWLHECSKAMAKLQSSDFQSTIHTPCLIVTASKDTIVSTNAAEYFAHTTRAAYAVGIPGSKHEILMECNMFRQQFWAAFDSFIHAEDTSSQTIG